MARTKASGFGKPGHPAGMAQMIVPSVYAEGIDQRAVRGGLILGDDQRCRRVSQQVRIAREGEGGGRNDEQGDGGDDQAFGEHGEGSFSFYVRPGLIPGPCDEANGKGLRPKKGATPKIIDPNAAARSGMALSPQLLREAPVLFTIKR